MSNGRASNLVGREPLPLRAGMMGWEGEGMMRAPSAVLLQATAQPSPDQPQVKKRLNHHHSPERQVPFIKIT